MNDFHAQVHELVSTHAHTEPYDVETNGTTWHRRHVTLVPSLVDQLRDASPSSSGDAAGSGGYGSRPAARIEALDALAYIDLEAARWVRDLGEDDPADTAACISLLHGLWASADNVTQESIELDVRRWWIHARIVSGWDDPPWRLRSSCPLCRVRGGLRIKRDASGAVCVECRGTWGGGNILLLAEHIRLENGDDEAV